MNDDHEIQSDEMDELKALAREACDGGGHVDCDDQPDCQGECQEEAPWGAHPMGEDVEAPFKIGAEAVILKMHTEEGEEVEVSLLQVVNQMFLDMGHIHMRLLGIERAAGLAPPEVEEEAAEEPLILMPDTDIEV